jgi:hypothetical protein
MNSSVGQTQVLAYFSLRAFAIRRSQFRDEVSRSECIFQGQKGDRNEVESFVRNKEAERMNKFLYTNNGTCANNLQKTPCNKTFTVWPEKVKGRRSLLLGI